MHRHHPDALTAREREVLDLVRRGLTNEEIAQRLGISPDGAKYHVSQILSKLGVATREEAAAWQPGERRPWWATWPTWAKIGPGAAVAAAAAGVLAVVAVVWDGPGDVEDGSAAESGDGASRQALAPQPTTTLDGLASLAPASQASPAPASQAGPAPSSQFATRPTAVVTPSPPSVITDAPERGGTAPVPEGAFAVDATHDAVDASPGDSVCADAGGACTLRAAVMETNAVVGADMIWLPAATYVLSIPPAPGDPNVGPFDGTAGDIEIRDDLTIVGAGREVSVIDGGGLDRIFNVAPPPVDVVLQMSGVTLRNGKTTQSGGAMFIWGEVAIVDSAITGNTAGSGGGIGLASTGDVTLIGSVVSDNSASMGGHGGGIEGGRRLTVVRTTISGNTSHDAGGIMSSGQVTIRESTLAGNSSGCCGYGGALAFYGANVDISNSTISGNFASCFGGGIASMSRGTVQGIIPTQLKLSNVTLSGNETGCSGQGGNIYTQDTSSATLVNTIIAQGGLAGDCSGSVTSLGHNLDSDGSCALSGPADLSNTNPQLGPLADNGGPTQTHSLLAGSPAIDGGDNAGCPATDQRGVPRPQDGDRNGSAVCDIGAFEAAAV